ncbi:MAG: CarD family transcriptional regulator [Acidobacteria bacterium]|nr:CarD family transcriptional regulator [Acidobacteriota bacterium]
MEFIVGDKVVYPNHGLGYIEEIAQQKIAGQQIHFYQLRLMESNSTILIPVDNVDSVGLRRTISRKDAESMLKSLASDCTDPTIDWKDRFRENSDKMKSGKICDVIDVLKSLARVNTQKSLSFREKKMYDRAKRLLIMELAAVLSSTEENMEHVVDDALLKSVGLTDSANPNA